MRWGEYRAKNGRWITRFEVEGQWWLPGEPEQRLRGSLSHRADAESALKLNGHFPYSPKTIYGPNPDLILGRERLGDAYSLIYCVNGRISPAIARDEVPAERDMVCSPAIVIEGMHLKEADEAVVKTLIVEFNYLTGWHGRPSVEIESTSPSREFRIFHVGKAERSLMGDFGSATVYICTQPGHPGSEALLRDGVYSISVMECSHLRFEFPGAVSLRKSLDIVEEAAAFLSLASNLPFRIAAAWMELPESVHSANKGWRRFPSVYIRSSLDERFEFQADWQHLVEWKDIEDKSQCVIEKWHHIRSKVPQVTDLYLGYVFNEKQPTIYTFLSMAQALESFHREFVGGTERSTEDHEKRIEDILGRIEDKKLKKWTEGKLKFSNELPFRRRICDLLNDYGEGVFVHENDRKLIAYQIEQNRNYYTHFSPKADFGPAWGERLAWLARYSKLLLDMVLLKSLSFPESEVVALVGRHAAHTNLIRYLQRTNESDSPFMYRLPDFASPES